MHSYIIREMYATLKEELDFFPALAILGPRQCGKSTLAKELLKEYPDAIYLDLQLPSDLRKLDDPEFFFEANADALICLDEIQRVPELFSVMRAIIDKDRRAGRFLLLGSASKTLIQQSSETLAGRIGYFELTPFLYSEVMGEQVSQKSINDLWIRGGFPESYLAPKENFRQRWLENYMITYVERDVPALGIQLSPERMHRLMAYCAHLHGQTVNWSKIAEFLGVSHQTAKNYFEIIEGTFLIRLLLPYATNSKKRLVKSPKMYFRDTGLLHYLLNIGDLNTLLGHTALGESWEGFAIEQILGSISQWDASFYRTSNGTEIDLILEKGENRIAVEFKASTSPKVGKGFFSVIEDLHITDAWVICPIEGSYDWKPNIKISGIADIVSYLQQK